MADEQDRNYVRIAEAALDTLFDKYASATPAEKWHLKPAITKAAEVLLDARLALFKEGTLISAADLQQLTDLKAEIDAAADTQATILLAIKLAALLGAFA
ncbi:MAG: hypothetical protein ACK5RJ_14220 [Burkholderiales bacterium]|jgi:hypothetical protein|nr:hypothetical protein [Rhodocyclaceae bacterium]MCA3022598.1 hypothetical protein [Rhodocyclaceae bacterium]MCA3051808.1 hypothetical protein [Rhodocyclaceae bacterium]MCA3056386.1 hypothetical protein [Rhodocyclaceae bacterium]